MSFKQDIAPQAAPTAMWLQGGPGSSSMLGLFELHGPFKVVDNNGTPEPQENPWSWNKVANMIYVDQPVGTGMH